MEILIDYIKSIFRHALKYAEDVGKDFDEKSIHKMRIELKKIQAAFNLLLFYCNGKLKQEEIEKVKNTFRRAGKMRELQLVISGLGKVKDDNEHAAKILLHFMKKKERKAEKKFREYFESTGKDELKELKKIMLTAAEEFGQINLTYFDELVSQIITLEKKMNRTDNELHQLRKLLKEFGYNIVLLCEEDKEKYLDLFPSEATEKLEKLIGVWHDETIFRKRIKKAHSKFISEIDNTKKQNESKQFLFKLERESSRKIKEEKAELEQLIKSKKESDD